jgi:DNA-binding PadR family transcriptional regulator
MIIETSDNRFYRVTETGQKDLDHVWFGIPVKKVSGQWVLTAAAIKKPQGKSAQLVRKAASRVVEA